MFNWKRVLANVLIGGIIVGIPVAITTIIVVKKTKNITFMDTKELKEQEEKNKYLINEFEIEYEKAIKKIQNEFLELPKWLEYSNSLEEKYTKTFHEKVQTFYDEHYSKLINADLKKFYTEWKNELLKIEIPFKSKLSIYNNDNFKRDLIKTILGIEYANIVDTTTFKNELISWELKKNNLKTQNCISRLKHFNSLDTSNLDWNAKWDLINEVYTNFFAKTFNWDKKEFDKRINEIIDELDKHYQLFTQDAWMVTPKDELVDTSHFSYDNLDPFIDRNGYNEINYIFSNIYELANNYKSVLDIKDKNRFEHTRNISDDEWNEMMKKGKKLLDESLELIKNSVGTIVNKNWNLEQTTKALAKYLVYKNDYTRQNRINAITFISLKDNVSSFLCQGYSAYMYIALNLLGYKNVGFESEYRYVSDKSYIPHVNNTCKIDNKLYAIDITFADKFRQNNEIYENKVIEWNTKYLSAYEQVNEWIDKFVLVPMNDYLNQDSKQPLYISITRRDLSEFKFE